MSSQFSRGQTPVCLLFCLALVSLTLAGCSSKTGGSAGDSIQLTGSGASFPYPLYDRWFKAFSRANDGLRIDYQSKGSGAGIKDFTSGMVDFAASDAAMTDDEIAAVDGGVQLLPLAAGKVVLAYNLDGIDELNLSRRAYSGIFLGTVTRWNDPLIIETNPGVDLPDQTITVVRRADSSGTTFVFTQHLSAISPDWASGPGTGKTVVWPSSDKFVASPKNDGVTATITQTPGAIGYIEYGYAKLTKLSMASLENQAGNFIQPTLASGRAALANVQMPADLRAWLPDPAGEDAFPIVSYTWLLCYENYPDPRKAEAIRDLVEYCLTDGQAVCDEMGYIPFPQDVVDRVLEAAAAIQ